MQFVAISVARQLGQVADNILKKRWLHLLKTSVVSATKGKDEEDCTIGCTVISTS